MSDPEWDIPANARDTGEQGEAVVSSLISEILGGDMVYEHDGPQGTDHVYLLDDELHVAETKAESADEWYQSYTSKTVSGRQMDSEWVSDRLERIGIDASGDEVEADLFQVDFVGGTIGRYDLDSDGFRTDNAPEEIYSLADVLEIHALNQELDEEPVAEVIDSETTDEDETGETDGGPQ